ncbi:MAG: gamma-glutamylcyclotransferase [Burkholderiaceae bacterium]|jgi:cation transport protein ChaC
MAAFDRPASSSIVVDPPEQASGPDLPDWVFGYGSLIWDPGFDHRGASLGQVHGYHRTFCIRSTRYRGTPEQPGVVLGLDRGGSCIGMVFRLAPETRRRAVDALYEREMTGGVYVARLLSVVLEDGQRVQALAFVANRQSPAYERLSDDAIVDRLTACCGQRGPNRDYALRTWRSLADHGVHCPHLGRVGRRLLAAGCE